MGYYDADNIKITKPNDRVVTISTARLNGFRDRSPGVLDTRDMLAPLPQKTYDEVSNLVSLSKTTGR
jgi:hypothetical protein